jgi:hypothetical protein
MYNRVMQRCLVFVVSFVVGILSLISMHQVSAHISGQSTFKINGEYTVIDLSDTSKSIDKLEDEAFEWYEVNQPVTFEINTAQFESVNELFEKALFIWDFGDGTPVQHITHGVTTTHTYTKTGTHPLTVYVDFSPAGIVSKPQLLQSVKIPILQPVSATMSKSISELPAQASAHSLSLMMYTILISASLILLTTLTYFLTKK